MAKIVCIAEGTVRPGINAIGDVVSIHDDNVDLAGTSYTTFGIVEMPGLTAEQVRESLKTLMPEEAMAYKTAAVANEWSLAEPEEQRVWKDGENLWRFLEDRPKYPITLADVTEAAKISLADYTLSAAARLLTIESQAKAKILLDEKNLVEAVDLNRTIVLEPR